LSQPTMVKVTGAIASAPSGASIFSSSLQEFLGLNFTYTYGAKKSGDISVNSTDMSPFSIPFEGILKGRIFAMRLISGGTMKVLLTTALGVAALPISDELLIHSPNPGDQFTAIQLVGSGDVRYFMAGDTD